MTEFEKGYIKAIEDFSKRAETYYKHLDTTQGASVQYYIKQIKKELLGGLKHENNA